MNWIGRLICFIGIHQWIIIKQIWVQYPQPMYYDGKYAREGEHITSVIYCPRCGKRIEINIEK